MINKALIEVYSAGDYKGRAFTFPIPTYNITEDFPWDDENVNSIFDMTGKYGLPYFQNFVGSQYKRVRDADGKIKRFKIQMPILLVQYVRCAVVFSSI